MGMLLQTKSSLINAWRSFNNQPLKHTNAVIRPTPNGQMQVSFGSTFCGVVRPGVAIEDAPPLNAKWRRALEADLKSRGIDSSGLLRSMGLDV